MAQFGLSYEVTLTQQNASAVAAALVELRGLVGDIRLRADRDAVDVDKDLVFAFFRDKVGTNSQVSISVTEEVS
jgi:hypothetical protein